MILKLFSHLVHRLDGSGNKIDGEVIEIYKEEIDGLKLYCCPFCDFSPLASDIKFRKHLKKEHPTKKILLKDSKKPNDKNTLSDNEKSSIFSILNNKENQALGISVHDSKVCVTIIHHIIYSKFLLDIS